MKNIKREQWEDVKIWLQKFDIPKLQKVIWRDFSDGVLFAHILKKLYPKYVEIHNYPSSSSTSLKFNNWETLNRKVLKKLNLTLTNEFIDRLIKAESNAIKKLLYDIMVRSQEDLNRSESECMNKLEEDGDIMTIIVTQKIGDAIVQVPQKMILYSLYENILNAYDEQTRTIGILEQKVTHFENLLKLKSQRIDNLVSSLTQQQYSPGFLDELRLKL